MNNIMSKLICQSKVCKNAKDGKCTLSRKRYDECRSKLARTLINNAVKIGIPRDLIEKDIQKMGL